MRRGHFKKPVRKLLTVWIPEALLSYLDQGVQKEDSDRAKFIRAAIREKLGRQGMAAKQQSKNKPEHA
jgi:metal-responsive CopG/Arc/MetJ family transcriptional regulator